VTVGYLVYLAQVRAYVMDVVKYANQAVRIIIMLLNALNVQNIQKI